MMLHTTKVHRVVVSADQARASGFACFRMAVDALRLGDTVAVGLLGEAFHCQTVTELVLYAALASIIAAVLKLPAVKVVVQLVILLCWRPIVMHPCQAAAADAAADSISHVKTRVLQLRLLAASCDVSEL
jgi:hypothetical protein